MVAVFMGNANPVQIFYAQSQFPEMGTNPLRTDPRIYQNTGIVGPHQGAVSTAATGKITERDFRHVRRLFNRAVPIDINFHPAVPLHVLFGGVGNQRAFEPEPFGFNT